MHESISLIKHGQIVIEVEYNASRQTVKENIQKSYFFSSCKMNWCCLTSIVFAYRMIVIYIK